MNSTIFPPAMGKIVGQTELFSLDMATGLEEGKTLNSKPVKLYLKIGLLLHSACAEGFLNINGFSNIS